ncbi:ribonuclease III [Vagococcus penaei]|uniref:Ribonuclease 3 n=1 Tax=Vagococcus penaei TaxID=633807 RepID=A0A1Q2D6J8_9ENTE|nr:ribonuclease III [Vagococcus penaei]AQP54078.1 ribonuclease III [Vagococcus penaei]RST98486.1 ribonuclease III [Vagococcus penaei]
MHEELLALLKKTYDVSFKDIDLLAQAFTHSSYVNEHRHLELTDNERLEFLGDAVLELIVSDYLYKHFTDLPEGKLTKLRATIVKEDSLAQFAKDCGFDKYVRLGKGEENSRGRERSSLLCDLFESFLGALYLDQGMTKARAFIYQVVIPKIESGAFSHEMDHKTVLQEVLQKNGDILIEYCLVNEEGPAHNRIFYVEVSADKKVLGTGFGKSKKTAEQKAAEVALAALAEKTDK